MTWGHTHHAVVARGRDMKVAREQALVLRSVGIPSEVRQHEDQALVLVPHDLEGQALVELSDYVQENRDWPPRHDSPPLRSRGRLAAALYCLVLIAIFPMGQLGAFGINVWERGKMDVAAFWSGDWWRCLTPLTLHGDESHLLGNLIGGVAFGILCCHGMGAGLTWFTIVVAGGLGNLLSAAVQEPQHTSIGASTAVFAAVGMLASFEWMRRHILRRPPMRRYAPLAGGVVLLAYLGAGGERTDVVAHLTGFLAGALCGALLSWLRAPERLGRRGQIVLACLAPLPLVVAWAAALTG